MPVTKATLLLLMVLVLHFASMDTYAQSPQQVPQMPPDALRPAPTASARDGETQAGVFQERPVYTERTPYETQLGWGILIFGFLVIGLQVLLMLRLKKGWGTQSVRMAGLTLVLTSGLFLIVTGYSQQQIAPMIGLLGTITGFLLGKTSSAKEAE